MSSEDYQEAVKILKGRFRNESPNISFHGVSIKMNTIASRGNIKLKMQYNHVEKCVSNLKFLKIDTSGCGSLLIPVLDEIKMSISRKFGKEFWTLDYKVMEYFNSELGGQENYSAFTLNGSVSNESYRKGRYTISCLFAW